MLVKGGKSLKVIYFTRIRSISYPRMSSILTSLLKFTIGILVTKLRDEATRRLFGDPTDESFRELISRELNEIKSKLDALLRKDLLSSVEFLEDGICHLQMSISRSEPSTEECDTLDSGASLSLTRIGLAKTTGLYVITSKERYERAQESFKIAGREATRAFSNSALEIDDRILATKLRITARILEGIKDLESAVNAGVMYLESLHELPAVQEAFSVYLDGSVKSIFNKTERLQIIQNVTMINLVLFSFVRRFTCLPRDLFNWPNIKLEDERIYQPVLRSQNIPLEEFDVHEASPFQFKFGNGIEICNVGSIAVDSKGNIIAETKEGILCVINTITGKAEILHNFCKQDTTLLTCRIDSVSIDSDDNIFVITCSKNQMSFSYKLWVFEPSGEIKHDCVLEFLSSRHIVGITTQIKVRNKFLLIKKTEDEHVYVCEANGKLKFSFSLVERLGQVFLSNSDENEILVGHGETVCVYTYKGNLIKTIKVPDSHKIHGVAFNEITKKIIVICKTSNCMHVLSYDRKGNMQTLSLGLDMWSFCLCSHPKCLVALVDKKGGLFI